MACLCTPSIAASQKSIPYKGFRISDGKKATIPYVSTCVFIHLDCIANEVGDASLCQPTSNASTILLCHMYS